LKQIIQFLGKLLNYLLHESILFNIKQNEKIKLVDSKEFNLFFSLIYLPVFYTRLYIFSFGKIIDKNCPNNTSLQLYLFCWKNFNFEWNVERIKNETLECTNEQAAKFSNLTSKERKEYWIKEVEHLLNFSISVNNKLENKVYIFSSIVLIFLSALIASFLGNIGNTIKFFKNMYVNSKFLSFVILYFFFNSILLFLNVIFLSLKVYELKIYPAKVFTDFISEYNSKVAYFKHLFFRYYILFRYKRKFLTNLTGNIQNFMKYGLLYFFFSICLLLIYA